MWVWYATNRQDLRDTQGRLQGFAKTAAPTTTYGKCLVHIPKTHSIGQTKSNFWRRMLLTFTFRQDDEALRLVGTLIHDATPHWTEIQAAAAEWPADERCALVFIHGYNVSFEDAAIRAAQIGYDLQVRGPVSFFSWPSQGNLLGYAADEAAIEASEAAITQYLLDFAQHSGAKRVHVIAHSMGNRGLLRALQRIATGTAAETPKLFEHIILAAPDVDQALFLNLAEYYGRTARHTTLYVSSKDKALAGSRMLRTGMARAGLTPPVTIAPRIDTVQVANIDLTLLGHGYVAEAREVLTDMHQLLYQNAAPAKRMGLRAAQENGHSYWIIGA
ncbi:alpha/beta hydrolase [Hymenobacter agri]